MNSFRQSWIQLRILQVLLQSQALVRTPGQKCPRNRANACVSLSAWPFPFAQLQLVLATRFPVHRGLPA